MNFDENLLSELCDKYGLTYYLTTVCVTIKTKYASWRFDYTKTPYRLYHKPIIIHNYFVSINANDGYHDQKRSFEELQDLVEYIYTHDKDYFSKPKHPLPKKKKRNR